MLAQLIVNLPFSLAVPEGMEFPLYENTIGGYTFTVYPPMRGEHTPLLGEGEKLEVAGTSAFQADVLRIDFHKESFERDIAGLSDPPKDVLKKAVNWFLIRLRHVTRAPQIRLLNFPLITWHLKYLNDDGTELSEQEGLSRGRGAIVVSNNNIPIDNNLWEELFELPYDYEPRPWESLLLDAREELPNIGPAIVLASTALEVFITRILDELVGASNFSEELWQWINGRGDWQKEPSTEERYDSLLKILTEHSLKEENLLWERFKHIRRARNSFVHEGEPIIGQEIVDEDKARTLVGAAPMIISKVREWLPEEIQWPEYSASVEMKFGKQIM